MIGQMGSFEYPSASIDEPLDCYLHGYVSSRIMNLARNCPEGQGLPICVATSKNYRSAILHGYASLVTDEEEKLWAMKLITNSVLEDRWDHSRVPPDRAEMQSTVILKVKIVSGSGKIRDGGVSDERKDSDNEQVTKTVWTGVIPVWETLGAPIPSGDSQVAAIPEYISSFIAQKNSQNQALAEGAVKVQLPPEEQH
ncbi:unnamed protein product [Penicillium olsonii]|nr:unnamed protein product [Penicillium olsonii]